MTRIAINGFGRIGRCVLRAIYERGDTDVQVVAINEVAATESMAYLAQYDTTHGRFAREVRCEGDLLWIGEDRIVVSHEERPGAVDWSALGVDVLIECSGTYSDRATAQLQLDAGAGAVLFSQPADADVDLTLVYGVNHQALSPEHRILSAGSCTTNCVIPPLMALEQAYGIESAQTRTLHAAMNDQPVIDGYHHGDLRRNRSAFESIIPVETELARGIGRLLPRLESRIECSALRLPLSDVSAMDIGVVLQRDASLDEVRRCLIAAADEGFLGVMGYTNQPLVSCDFVHDPRSLIIDLQQLRMAGSRHLKLLAWFDNEWGFANRLLDILRYRAGLNASTD